MPATERLDWMRRTGKATSVRGAGLRPFWNAVALLLMTVVAGCATRPGPEVLATAKVSAVPPDAKRVTAYVATTRKRATSGTNVFTSMPTSNLNYAAFTISVPPAHKPGAIEWPKKDHPDPATTFVTLHQSVLDERQFLKGAVPLGSHGGKRDVVVFVHGYNTNFEEALFRVVQLAADSGMDTAPILFAWPSEASLAGYLADKDAATFSRDGLVRLLTILARDPGIGRITLFGHSMGCWLSMEALRQLRLTGKNDVIGRLNVILAAPDIDIDVFAAQMTVVGPLDPPMTIFVSNDDRALSVSRRISSGRPRLGALKVDDPWVEKVAREEDLRIVDISGVKGTNRLNHDRYVGLAALYPRLSASASARPDENLRRAGAFIFNTVGLTLSTPFTLAGKALAGE